MLKTSIKPGSKKKNINRISKQPKNKLHPRSYRFDSEIMSVLNATLDRINKVSPKKVQEARLVKALILLSRELDDEMLIKAIREVW